MPPVEWDGNPDTLLEEDGNEETEETEELGEDGDEDNGWDSLPSDNEPQRTISLAVQHYILSRFPYGIQHRRYEPPLRFLSREEFNAVPSEKGRELMNGNDFSSVMWDPTGRAPRKGWKEQYLLRREMGAYNSRRQMKACQAGVVQSYLPESKADLIIAHDYHCYIGQFSVDGNFFYTCTQDMKVRMYDTSDPYNWVYYKTVDYVGGRWTITDAALSPDNKFLAYSSMRSAIFLADTTPGRDYTLQLELATGVGPHSMHYSSGIMSVRFSGDGKELIVGAKDDCVYIYDIITERPVLKLRAHEDEVNAVCYGDSSNPHIIFSGSDDTTIKVWDRRSLSDRRPAGVFIGHTEGITFVSSKGDGRYVLSNGKDQQMKLWDLRNMMDYGEFDQLPARAKYLSTGFDYRTQRYPTRLSTPRRHPYDRSLVTYEGHSVHRTLIRCYFSPPVSTGSRYVYSGCASGKVRIYNIDATLAREVDVHAATESMRVGQMGHSWWEGYEREYTCVRDVSWHPSAPVFAATGFQGGGIGKGSVSVHTWKGADAEWGDKEKREKLYKPKIYSTTMVADV